MGNYSWIFYALLSAVFAATIAIFGKLGISKIDSTLATAVRAVIMAVFMVVTALSLGKFSQLNTIDKRALIFIAAAGVAGALSWIFYFLALQKGPVNGVVALDRLSVVIVVLLSFAFLGERLSWQTIAGAAILTGGAIMMSIK